jgi:uncharacterized protein (TIGR02145 family)
MCMNNLILLFLFLPVICFNQNLDIPDAAFKKYLVCCSGVNTNGDAEIQVSEASSFNDKIDCSNSRIKSLIGIESFTALTELICENNKLTTLDISKNISLIKLSCKGNKLTTLDVSKNTSLTELNCGVNQITALNVSKNISLTKLNCQYNKLTTLDVSKNISLTMLYCDINQLTSLDVSKNTGLTWLSCTQNQLTSLDVSKNIVLTKLYCVGNKTTDLVKKYDPIIWSIGTQVWMTSNLDVSTFRNGDPIREAKTDEEWREAGDNKKPAWCYYENDPANGEKYGKLYNWYAVIDPRGLAPVGYHIPSDHEWSVLTDFLTTEADKNGINEPGRKRTFGYLGVQMHRADANWTTCDFGNNSSGFSGLPGGSRDSGIFDYVGYIGSWWSSSEISAERAWFRSLSCANLDRSEGDKNDGFSVRCLKN